MKHLDGKGKEIKPPVIDRSLVIKKMVTKNQLEKIFTVWAEAERNGDIDMSIKSGSPE